MSPARCADEQDKLTSAHDGASPEGTRPNIHWPGGETGAPGTAMGSRARGAAGLEWPEHGLARVPGSCGDAAGLEWLRMLRGRGGGGGPRLPCPSWLVRRLGGVA